MGPKQPDNAPDLFRVQLTQILNPTHPLMRLSEKMNQERLEAGIDVIYVSEAGNRLYPSAVKLTRQMRNYTVS